MKWLSISTLCPRLHQSDDRNAAEVGSENKGFSRSEAIHNKPGLTIFQTHSSRVTKAHRAARLILAASRSLSSVDKASRGPARPRQ